MFRTKYLFYLLLLLEIICLYFFNFNLIITLLIYNIMYTHILKIVFLSLQRISTNFEHLNKIITVLLALIQLFKLKKFILYCNYYNIIF